MTITEQIRLKLKTVDEELEELDTALLHRLEDRGHIFRARKILREICELDVESEE